MWSETDCPNSTTSIATKATQLILVCSTDIKQRQVSRCLVEFVCCSVCWLVGFGFFTSFTLLIIFEMPVNLLHCMCHLSIPGDTQKIAVF